ncbi:MAG: TIGR04149 family rSAM-modified RiPP [Bacteroidales bacterium]|jgi:natural product precursor|nr:TIGR04149 family rSAM-modified RiPP [Bacteroidales bacterium]
MKKLKLTDLENNNLSEKEMNNLKGGKFPACSGVCVVLGEFDLDQDATADESKDEDFNPPKYPRPHPPVEYE